jgi:hypothetical protein
VFVTNLNFFTILIFACKARNLTLVIQAWLGTVPSKLLCLSVVTNINFFTIYIFACKARNLTLVIPA